MSGDDDLLTSAARLAAERRDARASAIEAAHDSSDPPEPAATTAASADIWAQVQSPSAARMSAIKEDLAHLAPPPPEPPPTRQPRPIWARLRAAFGGWGPGLVLAGAAAAVVFAVAWPRPTPGGLPAFHLLPVRGVADTRATPDPVGVPMLTPDSSLNATLKPEVDATDVAVRAFVMDGNSSREVSVPPGSVRPTGTIELRASVADWFGREPGPRVLILAVGRPGPLGRLDVTGLPTGSSEPDVQLFRQELRVTPPAP